MAYSFCLVLVLSRAISCGLKPTHGRRRGFRIDGQRCSGQETAGIRALLEPCQSYRRSAAVLRLVNIIFALERAMDMKALRVGLELGNFCGDVFGEEKLSDMRDVTACINPTVSRTAQMDLQVDVYRAAVIPTRIERGEFNDALLISDLHAAQEARAIDMARRRRAHPRPVRPVPPGPSAVVLQAAAGHPDLACRHRDC